MLITLADKLQELSLTRIDIGQGSLINLFAHLRYHIRHPEVLELHGVFRKIGEEQLVDMDRMMEEEDWNKFEEEDRRAMCAECEDEPRSVGYHTSNVIMTRSSHVVRKRVRFVIEWIQKVTK